MVKMLWLQEKAACEFFFHKVESGLGQGRGEGYLPPAGGLVHLGGRGAPVLVPVLQDPAGLGQTLHVDPPEIWKRNVRRHAASSRPPRGQTNL